MEEKNKNYFEFLESVISNSGIKYEEPIDQSVIIDVITTLRNLGTTRIQFLITVIDIYNKFDVFYLLFRIMNGK